MELSCKMFFWQSSRRPCPSPQSQADPRKLHGDSPHRILHASLFRTHLAASTSTQECHLYGCEFDEGCASRTA